MASALPSLLSDPTPIAVPGRTPSASAAGDGAPATLTLGAFGEADGPGLTVGDALARGPARDLVNGILLTEVDGTVWLCDALVITAPPDCAEPRLLVVNLPPESETDAGSAGHHVADGVRWQDRVQLYGDVSPAVSAPGPTSPPAPAATETSEWAPPTPVCPAPPNAVQVPTVTVSVGGPAILATNGSSGFQTCSTSASSDAAPEDPTAGMVAQPGDLMTLTVSSGWRILRWEGYDHSAKGEGANVWPPVVTPEGPAQIQVPVPLRSGDSIAGYTLSLVSADGRAVGGLDILVRVTVQ